MANPFASRLRNRFFIVLGSFFASYIVPGIFESDIFYFVPLIVLFGLPIYFVMQDNNWENSCIELVRNKYSRESILTVEAYHPNMEWGFLILTKQALFFIPKKGEIVEISLSYISNYGVKSIGTGEFTTITSRVGNTGLNINSTRENKAPVFYIYLDNDPFYWYIRKHENMFNAMKKVLGYQRVVGTDTSK